MTQDKNFLSRRRAVGLAVTAALAALATAPAFADPVLTARLFKDTDILFRDADMSRWSDNYVELGVGNNTQEAYRFGQFSGLTKKGAFPVAGFNWLSRDANNDAQYWHIFGSTLGLDSRKLQAEGGIQGRWNASFSFDQLNKSLATPTYFIHDGLGTSNLTLPATFTTGGNASNTAVINPRLRQFEVQQERDILRIGLNGLVGSNWDWKVNFREDKRDGTRLTGFVFSRGGTNAVIVPYQIDDRTRQIEAILAYNSKLAQFSLGYTYSQFHNNRSSFNVRNPFTNTAGQTGGQLSLAPSNDFHQIDANGAYNFSKTTRLTSKFSYSIARQNEAFLPYSVDAAATAAINTPPRASLDGKVIKTLLDVALTAKPVDKLNLKLAYQYSNSDNQTPVANYLYLGRDGATSSTTTSRRNAPLSTREQKFSLDGDYEIAPKTHLRAGLERRNVKYSAKDGLYENAADRDYTNTDKLTVELRRPVSANFLGSVGYTYTQRTGSEYDKNSYFRNTYWSSTHITTNRLNANPNMRSYLYADFKEDRIRAAGNWTASETVTLQSSVDTYRRRAAGPNCGTIVDATAAAGITTAMTATCLGRTLSEGTNLNLDVQWQPEENLTTFAFASYGESGTQQRGRTWNRNGTQGADETRDWTAKHTDRDHTLGFGLKWQPEDLEKWDLGGTYVINNGVGKTAISTGPSIGVGSDMPNNWSKLHTLQLFAKWDYSKQVSWRFNYLYENLKSADWAYDGLVPGSNANVLLTGQTAPRSSNHVFGVSAMIKNW